MGRLGVLLVLVATMTAACGSSKQATAPTTSTSGSPTTTSAAPRNVKVFFVEGEQFHAVTRPVASGADAARTAVQALLDGPTAAEEAQGIETTIPTGAHLDDLSIASGPATVSFSHAQTKATAFDVSLRPARARRKHRSSTSSRRWESPSPCTRTAPGPVRHAFERPASA